MKPFCLAMLVSGEEQFIYKIFPAVSSKFSGVVILDSGIGPATREFLSKFPIHITPFNWCDDYALARNMLIDEVRRLGYTRMMQLDADEMIYPSDVKILQHYLDECDIVRFPRINFINDDRHFCPDVFPDYQDRAFNLDKDIRYGNKVHENIINHDSYRLVITPSINIYHYGWCKPIEEITLKNINYERIKNSQEKLKRLPEGFIVQPLHHRSMSYIGDQP